MCYFFLVAGVFTTDITLRVLGSNSNDSTITICPDDNYMFIAECVVTESSTFFWTLSPLIGTVPFSSANDLGEFREGEITFIVTKQVLLDNEEQNSYVSQVQVHTEVIRKAISEHHFLNISCEASVKFEMMTFALPGRHLTHCHWF